MGSLTEESLNTPGAKNSTAPVPGLWITGIGSACPPYCLRSKTVEVFAKQLYDVEKPGLKKLLQINKTTGIDTRSSAIDYGADLTNAEHTGPPSISDLDAYFRSAGVEIAVEACRLALKEWDGPRACLRIACELCTPMLSRELAEAEACEAPARLSIGAALFGVGAGAFVLCNEYGVPEDGRLEEGGLFRLWEWGSETIPDTLESMSSHADARGYRAVLTREVPSLTTKAIPPILERLLPTLRGKTGLGGADVLDFDWALHPGGQAIIRGAQKLPGLTDDQLRATKNICKTRGNCSSAAVLMVLDSLGKWVTGRMLWWLPRSALLCA
ncbi:hypothetical protein INS49_015137 [Diaporthe citri]|uniref:uncharacterized protein n=1 Tax=Diaporthe citri TaxID=83186 RepID=UPI001C82030A|nr:uncharacterized protein INS49_015137 [Diaporthe citri]KAG6357259.1 hypothetical protein INS49_015137 [Diaporthe citri]